MLFDFERVPFSKHQRFTTLSMMGEGADRALYLRYVAGGDEKLNLGRLCRVSFEDKQGRLLRPEFVIEPHTLSVKLYDESGEAGQADFAIGDGEVLHFRSNNAVIVFALEGSRYDYAYKTAKGDDCVVAASENLRLTPFAHQGDIAVVGAVAS